MGLPTPLARGRASNKRRSPRDLTRGQQIEAAFNRLSPGRCLRRGLDECAQWKISNVRQQRAFLLLRADVTELILRSLDLRVVEQNDAALHDAVPGLHQFVLG
jgi:hypothetical protein